MLGTKTSGHQICEDLRQVQQSVLVVTNVLIKVFGQVSLQCGQGVEAWKINIE